MIEIKDIYGNVILSGDFDSITELINANPKANLYNANLSNANLSNANLTNAKYNGLVIKDIHQFSRLGSRKSTLVVIIFEDGTKLYETGCFSGSEQEFVDAVNKTHNGNEHQKQYIGAVEFVNKMC